MNLSPLTVVLHRDKYYIYACNLGTLTGFYIKFEKVMGYKVD